MLHAIAVRAAEEATNPLVPAPADLIWATLCFLVILFFFWKVGAPRLMELLDARAEAIEGNMAKAGDAKAEADAALAEYTAKLAEARAEAAQIRDTARADGAQIIAEAREQAQSESARITAGAQAQIEAEREGALVSLRSEVGTLAIDIASGVIGESLADDKKAASIVDRFLAELEASENATAENSAAESGAAEKSPAAKSAPRKSTARKSTPRASAPGKAGK
jgi:F-type H+-transporting ATPase subunit b